jgi:sugar lactone lactonase YvrE
MEPTSPPGRSGLMSFRFEADLLPPLKVALLLLGLAAGAARLPAQTALDPVLASRTAAQAAQEAYARHDLAAFLARSREAARLRPDHGGVLYALASACALTADTAGALDALERFAILGYAADVAADSDLAPLRPLPRFAAVRHLLAGNASPLTRSDSAFTLSERDLLTEGLAYDPATRSFYLGSVRHRKIMRVGPTGRVTPFIAAGRDGMWAPLGMRVDPSRRWLWVAVTAVPQMIGYDSADAGRSGVMAVDLATGAWRARHLLPSDGRPHALGDVVVAVNGDVYASDSRSPTIYRVRATGDSAGSAGLEPWLTSPLLLSAQGMAFGRDQGTLYLADYARGILRIDLAGRTIQPVPSDGLTVLGIDGLYRAGDDLIGVQNGVAPARVIRLRLSPGGDRIVGTELLERGRPDYAEPTLGVVVGRSFYYVANSQWDRFKDDGSVDQPDLLRPPLVLRLPLSAPPFRR